MAQWRRYQAGFASQGQRLIRSQCLKGSILTTRAKFAGWTLAQARQKCVDRWLLQRDRSARTETWDALRHLLVSEKLLAWGQYGSLDVEPKFLAPAVWQDLIFQNVQTSVVREPEPTSTAIFDVRVYPVIEAPNAVELLGGMTLIEILNTLVYEDPEAIATRTALEAANAVSPSLGHVVGLYRAWPVRYGAAGNGKRIIGRLRHHDEQNDLVKDAENVLKARFGRLIDYLAAGDLIAEGVPRGSGIPVQVPRAQWQRRSTYVDVVNGDLLEARSDAEDPPWDLFSEPIFTGLEIRKPESSKAVTDSRVSQARDDSKRVVTTQKSKHACVEFLKGEMLKSPDQRPKPKASWWEEARQKWPETLTRRGFDDAWTEAAKATGALAWTYPGAPRKSPHA